MVKKQHKQHWRTAPRVLDAALVESTRVIDQLDVAEPLQAQIEAAPIITRLNASFAAGKAARHEAAIQHQVTQQRARREITRAVRQGDGGAFVSHRTRRAVRDLGLVKRGGQR